MVDRACEKKIVMAVNYTRRWQNSFILAKKIVNEGKIGNIRAVTAYYPGQIFNIGSHLFDTVRMITRIRPRSFSAVIVQSGPDPSISGWMDCDQDIHFSFIATGKREDLIFEIDVIGMTGACKYSIMGISSNFSGSWKARGIPGTVTVGRIREIRENDRFADAVCNIADVLDGTVPSVLCSGEDGLAVDTMTAGVLAAVNRQKSGHGVLQEKFRGLIFGISHVDFIYPACRIQGFTKKILCRTGPFWDDSKLSGV